MSRGMLDDAMVMLGTGGAVDLDSRGAEWRQGGWTGYQAASTESGGAAHRAEPAMRDDAAAPLLTSP
jgi:hypothetical protein